MTRPVGRDLTLIGLLAVVAYAPALTIPLLEDDYPNLAYAIGHAGGFLHDPVFRVRATSAWLMWGAWQAFGLAPAGYHVVSLLLHIGCCWLLYGLAIELKHAPRTALFAAAFFAVFQAPQEAVMWFSACNELLAFLFGAAALLLWMRGRAVASIVVFALALLSKESAVVWLALFALVERRWYKLWPHALLAAVAIGTIWMTRAYSFRFADGSFSLTAPFWFTWPRGLVRLLWPWGFAALPLARREAWRPLAWIAIALLPYSFLTYSTQIPSRQTYLASAGLALLVGTALVRIANRRAMIAAAALILAVNIGYLWTKKRAQFVERAEPTEQLIRAARQANGPLYVECFPRNHLIAEEAVHLGANKPPEMLRWQPEPGAATFCYKASR